MAEGRREYIYVSERDTGFPGSPPPTPAWGIGDRSGKRYDESAFGQPMQLYENISESAHGGANGGLDEPPLHSGGLAKDISTKDSTSKVTSTGRGASRELGARAKSRDSHVRGESHSRASGTHVAAGFDSAHRPGGGKLDDISDFTDAKSRQARQLRKEISRLQREIKTLSARRSRSARADITDMLSSDTSRSGEISLGHEPSLNVPPRTAIHEGEDRSINQPSTTVVRDDDQPVSVCVNDNVSVNLPGGPDQPRETVVRNKAVRVTDPALRVSSEATDATQGESNNCTKDLSANATGVHGTQRKQLKLEKYDGVSTPLETFLAKYRNCVKYNRWSDDECGVFLRDSLTGTASQVL